MNSIQYTIFGFGYLGFSFTVSLLTLQITEQALALFPNWILQLSVLLFMMPGIYLLLKASLYASPQ